MDVYLRLEISRFSALSKNPSHFDPLCPNNESEILSLAMSQA